jgi:glycosidase
MGMNWHFFVTWLYGLVLAVSLALPSQSDAGLQENLRLQGDSSAQGLCALPMLQALPLSDSNGDGRDDGVPLFFPPQSPVAVTLQDPVKVRFQISPPQGEANVYYRHWPAGATSPSAWSIAPASPLGIKGLPGFQVVEAVIPAIGGNLPVRVDYYAEARLAGSLPNFSLLQRGQIFSREPLYHRCELADDPFDGDMGGGHHLFSYVAAPKTGRRIYQIMMRNFGARISPAFQGLPAAGYQQSGTFCDITDPVLQSIRAMGFDTIWLTGLLDFDNNSPQRKGDAGSPYALRNPYRASPDLACDGGGRHLYPQGTAGEGPTAEATRQAIGLFQRMKAAGLDPMLDVVPNHVARQVAFFVQKVMPYEPQPIPLRADHIEISVTDGLPSIGNPRSIYPMSGNDFTDVMRLDLRNSRNRPGTLDPITGFAIQTGNGLDNTLSADLRPETPSSYALLDRIIETWQARGVGSFRVDFAHAQGEELFAYLLHQAKSRASGFGRRGASDAPYAGEAYFVAEGYDLDGWYGPDAGAIGSTGSSWANLYAAGFDSVYDKNGMLDQIRNIYRYGFYAIGIGQKYSAEARDPLAYLRDVGNVGTAGARLMLRLMSNHDEVQPAAGEWASDKPTIGPNANNIFKPKPAHGSAFLLPGSLLMYAGSEVGETAEEDNYHCPATPNRSPWCGTEGDGRTSFFDYVVSPQIRAWLDGTLDPQRQALRRYYSRLLQLGQNMAIAQDSEGFGYYDIALNKEWSAQSEEVRRYIHAFVRTGISQAGYLVVSNFNDKAMTVEFPLLHNGGAAILNALGIVEDGRQIQFSEVLATEDENGAPRSFGFSKSAQRLYRGEKLRITVPRWTTGVLEISR